MTSVSALYSGVVSNYAIFGLNDATRRVADSTARLASNNRLVNAGDDVAALSVSTQLRSRVEANRAALVNASQADSLLQVAYGGLNEISSILDSLNSLATQANSAALTPADRAALDLQFQQLVQEIDSIATSTNFNNINLLDGTISGGGTQTSNTSAATQAAGSITLTANPGAGQTIRLNNVTLTAGTDFAIGGSISATVTNLANALSSSTNSALSQASYLAVGNTLNITARAGGEAGNQFLINQNASTAAFTTAGGTTNVANLFTLQGGSNSGLSSTRTNISGTVGDSLVNTVSQTSASTQLVVSGTISNGEQLRIDDANGGFVNFTFATTPVASTDIQIGATIADTLANAVAVINNYSGTNDYGVRQLQASRNGNILTLTSVTSGNPTNFAGGNLSVAETLANGVLTSATLNNGVNTGINTDGVANSAFIGTISGFSATYNSANNVTAQVTVGGVTYTSNITNTAPGAATFARFNSTNGGYFDVQLAAGGAAVTNQTDANTFAARLDAAFSTLTVTQNRAVSSFTAAGQLAGASVDLQLSDFSDVRISDITVTPPPGAGLDATIDITINGEVFRSQTSFGGVIGDGEIIEFASLSDGNNRLTLRNGSTTIDISNQANADTFRDSLETAFGTNSGNGGLRFQLSGNSSDNLLVQVGDARSSTLFNNQTLDITTMGNAANAQTVLLQAIDTLTSYNAQVGSLQSRVGFTSANLESSIQAQDEARSVLADTDVAYESTQLSVATVQAQAAISVLAQTNLLRSDLLDLLKPLN